MSVLGEFFSGLVLPFTAPSLLLTVLAIAVRARQRGHAAWRVPFAVLFALVLGVLVAAFGIVLPLDRWVLPVLVIVLGVLVVLADTVPLLVGRAAMLAATLYLGNAVLAAEPRPQAAWCGLLAGCLLVLLLSLRLARFLAERGPEQALRGSGVAFLAAGVILLLFSTR